MADDLCNASLPNSAPCVLAKDHAGQHRNAAGWRWHSTERVLELLKHALKGPTP